MTSVETFAFALWTLPEAVINVHDGSGVQGSSLTTDSLASFDIINSASIISSTFELVEPCADSHGVDQVAVEAFLQAGQPYPGDDGVQAEQQQSLAQTSLRRFGEWHKASTKAECAPPNSVESPAWLENLGRALARCPELQPRLNVPCRTLWSLQLDSRIQAKDAGVGTILELEPDTSGGGGGALTQKLQPKMLEWVQFWNLSQTSPVEVVKLRGEAQSFDQG
ncbi:hypothetical protein C8J57DRAFT_1232141 [Mycena rebaudengoi]|nr:hypothetical protein C8J57DRAFT_1232141 [Mycena rebaudengoi]